MYRRNNFIPAPRGYQSTVDAALNQNPLVPKTPGAPPWDPGATAAGVYITNTQGIARDYATLVAEDEGTDPIIVVLDVGDLQKHTDPQALDLLYEPYMQYRYDVVNYARDAYSQHIYDLIDVDSPEARKAARRQLGPFQEWVINFALQNRLPPVRPEYLNPPSEFAREKVMAATTIFFWSGAWSLLPAIKEFYGDRARQVIIEWLGLHTDTEESPFSTNSVYLTSRHHYTFEPEFWYYISRFAYIAEEIPDHRILKILKLEPTGETTTIYDSGVAGKEIAYHGTGLNRVRSALSSLWAG